MKKLLIIALLVSLILSVLPALASCGNDENGGTANTPASNGETDGNNTGGALSEEDTAPDLPDVNYGGYSFRILNAMPMGHMNLQIIAEAETGDNLNDAIYHRNATIEENYGVTFAETLLDGVDAVRDGARKSIMADSDDYDMVMNDTVRSIPLAQEGMLYNFNNMPRINMAKPYYDQNMIRDNSIANSLFFLGGDFSLSHDSVTVALFFNKKLVADYGLNAPYQLVKDGEWTYERFFNMAKTVSEDLNGDSRFDENDRYGYMSLNFVAFPALIKSAGLDYVTKDSNDIPVLSMNNERFFNVYANLIEQTYQGNMFFDADAAGNHRFQDTMFPGNQALFWTELLNWSSILREMDADFGILPHPKYDDSQDRYNILVFNPFFMMIPTTNTNLDRTGVIIEALCAESYKSVKPVYHDTMLRTKVSRDDESGEMLDIMFANRSYDLAQLYWGAEISDLFNDNLSKRRSGDVASFIERFGDRMNTAIQKTIDAFTSLD